MNKILAVIRREFIERVRTRAFIIGTLIVPAMSFGFGYLSRAFMEREKIGRLEVLKGEGLVLRARDLPRLARRLDVPPSSVRLVEGKGLVLVHPAPFPSPRALLSFLERAFVSRREDGGGAAQSR